MTFQQFAFRNVLRSRRSYAAFFLASVFSVMVFFVYSIFIFHPLFNGQGLEQLAVRGMFIAELVLYVFTLFFLLYSMGAFLQARSKEFGLLMQLGMTKGQLGRLIFLETMIIGSVSILAGTLFGFAFSKFFLMIGRELMAMDNLPLYVSWKPFALTFLSFFSLFVLISIISMFFIRTREITDLLRGDWNGRRAGSYSSPLAVGGIVLLGMSYILASVVQDGSVSIMTMVIVPLATVGTYLFFTHTVHWILALYQNRKTAYWHRTRLISIAESAVKLKESAHMFFLVTIVSTVAFLTVGTLASFMSYTGDFRQLNPLGLLYMSYGNEKVAETHIAYLEQELAEEQLGYQLVPLTIKRQTIEQTGSTVDLLKESEFNALARTLGFPAVELAKGESVLLAGAEDIQQHLTDGTAVNLTESGVTVQMQAAYPNLLFPAHTLSPTALVLSDFDYLAVDEPPEGQQKAVALTYYAFNVNQWTETAGVGEVLLEKMQELGEIQHSASLSYYFENPGFNYRWFKSSFALLLFIGVLVAAVFLLAAGSFIYFKLYTGLERDRKQYALLIRLGMTEKELVKIVNRQLVPQFFLPWTLALIHSVFAFITLQTVWDEFAASSIFLEMTLVLAAFTVLQILYFYLIRWRYLVHLQAP
ncbi:FtsX-like permease family protein [Planococcus lenghuensis]|uniref:ABC transporter permease n=1 Tax=Planococcus lenghuensis TaxID=2213202 RepID=A0A1Q2KWH8_9BACL|nr:ABC transporter permease [Planococcus lenghuensis]AQQ52575.1 ABC transporter permease [Planococcus lenghuensis]